MTTRIGVGALTYLSVVSIDRHIVRTPPHELQPRATEAGSVPVPVRPRPLIATPPLKQRSRSSLGRGQRVCDGRSESRLYATAASALTDAGKTARPRQEPCIAAQHRGTAI
jgi:hypothetical protein